jgi:hypothetical protein
VYTELVRRHEVWQRVRLRISPDVARADDDVEICGAKSSERFGDQISFGRGHQRGRESGSPYSSQGVTGAGAPWKRPVKVLTYVVTDASVDARDVLLRGTDPGKLKQENGGVVHAGADEAGSRFGRESGAEAPRLLGKHGRPKGFGIEK